jgi:hypothetical protein
MKRSRLFSVLALVALMAAGVSCSTDRMTGPPSSPPGTPEFGLLNNGGILGTGVGTGLLACTPLPAASASQAIGPQGGTITVGPHSLVVPPGALGATVVITASAPSGTVNSVQLYPQGLKFAVGKPAILTLSYANCSVLGSLLPKHIAYTTDLLQILQLLPSLDDLLGKKVSAPLEHFSRYAVAW